MQTRFLAVALAVASTFVASSAFAEERGATLRLPLQYSDVTDAGDGPTFGRFLYFHLGVSFHHELFWIDAASPMPFVLVDGIASLGRFLSGGDEFLVFDGLNPLEEQPGFVRVFEGSFGPRFASVGDLHFGAGAYLGWSIAFPRFGGERVNHDPFDVGAAVRAWYQTEDWSARLELNGGNGWHDFGSTNPFVQLMPSGEVRLVGMLGLHMAGRIGYRSVDYRSFDQPRLFDGDPDDLRFRTDHMVWSVEAGPTLMF